MKTHPLMLPARLLVLGLPLAVLACSPPKDAPPPIAKVAVESEVVEALPFQASLRLLGRVEPSGRVALVAPVDGRPRYAPRFAAGLRTGETVRSGELLLTLENESLSLALVEAELALDGAAAELERAKRGVEGGFLPAAELKRTEIAFELARERLASAREQVARLELKAPASGVLRLDTVLPPGSEIQAGTVLAEIAAAGLPRVEAWATARDLERLEVGFEVECFAAGGRSVLGVGHVAELDRQLDPHGTARVVIRITDDRRLPPPGEGVELAVLLAARESALTLPHESLVIDGGSTHVFVLEPRGHDFVARQRLVVPGGQADERLEILDGLVASERVVVRGAELLADGVMVVDSSSAEGS